MSEQKKTHYVTELKQELAASKARIFLGREAIKRLNIYLTSSKFANDSTVQTSDVLHRLEYDVESQFKYNFNYSLKTEIAFIGREETPCVDLPAMILNQGFQVSGTDKDGKEFSSAIAMPYEEKLNATCPEIGKFSIPGVQENEHPLNDEIYKKTFAVRVRLETAIDMGLI